MAVLGILAVDGVLSALMAVFFLPVRIGSVPVPISALLSGILNALLVWVALKWTDNPVVAALPMWTWLATVLVFSVSGPGDNIVFGGVGIMEFAPLLLLTLGALPAAWLLTRRPPSPGR
ncbi:MAG: hypothetical protein U1C73_18655 [Dietzia sp.]|nr:hypothetical protein [Dietzia sp.]